MTSSPNIQTLTPDPTTRPAIGAGKPASAGAKAGPVVCILGASFGTGNMGVSALAAGTITSVLHSFPEARIRLIDYGKYPVTYLVTTNGGTAAAELVNIRFSWKPHLRNNIARLILTAFFLRILPSGSLRKSLISRNPSLKAILEAEMIGSLAGGDSFSDIYGLRRYFYVALPQLLVLALGKPLTLMPQTLGPFKSAIAKKVSGFIMHHAAWVYARDEEGLEVFRELGGGHGRHGFSYDMAFVLQPVRPAEARMPRLPQSTTASPVVGFNVSGLLYCGGYSGGNMFGLKTDYPAIIREIIDRLVGKHNAQIVLIPHVFGANPESDVTVCDRLYEELKGRYPGKIHVVGGNYDQSEIKYIIGQTDFFLGSRMHACIAALSQGIPAIGLAYSKKFFGVLRSIGVENLVVDLRDCDSATVASRVDEAFVARAKTRVELTAKMAIVRGTVSGIFAQIRARQEGANN